MKRYRIGTGCLLIAVLWAGGPVAADESVASALKDVVMANLAATEREDLDAVAATMHVDSMHREQTRRTLAPLFDRFDVKYELLDYEFVATSGEYAIARIRQRTTKVAGPDFRNNMIDNLLVFRKEGPGWKLWSQSVLEIEFE